MATKNLKRKRISLDFQLEMKNYHKQVNIDGTPYAVKVARTVWSGGKDGDNIKILPITIFWSKS